jgi:cardiolipin synthase
MFHIALPRRDHPTLRLLDALIAAADRGLRVRVLVDRDRAADPYKSTVINAAAVNYLLDGGVTVRVDAARKLLHSKFLVIDDERTIIGSHNWSAGSYFGFDDFSVEVVSARFAAQARRRFATLWAKGERASRSRQR